MSTYLHDGIPFDLTRLYADVTGVCWQWTGQHNAAGEPMMRSHTEDRETDISLPDLYASHGPLIIIATRPHASLIRDALTAVNG
ncbi:phiSA1p31-related protein [Streptomyces sp. SID10815]|uniref:phiSA1p31-related protein n=1 Tax=Streptomyces sp. SID10815 TaxID=2706027 RepID=UPI0013C5A771|nr:phiSA1p31-related protein [Streptomyces sp. SID10815]NEA52351.1 hypothetical protein [Streptomyces sp. SID10815]